MQCYGSHYKVIFHSIFSLIRVYFGTTIILYNSCLLGQCIDGGGLNLLNRPDLRT